MGWPEILSVLFGIIGGLAYLFTKQPIVKKLVILVLSFLANGVYVSLSNDPQTATTNSQEPQVQESDDSQRTTTSSQESQAQSIGTFADVRDDRSLRVGKSETVESIKANNPFADSVESKGGKLVAVYMTIENTGNESGDMTWTSFELKDNQDRTFKEITDFEEKLAINMWADEKGLSDPSNQLFPGETAEIVKVFRVSPDAEELELIVNNNIFAIN